MTRLPILALGEFLGECGLISTYGPPQLGGVHGLQVAGKTRRLIVASRCSQSLLPNQ